MTEPLKLFFDENMPLRFTERLLELYLEDYPDLQTDHIINRHKCGMGDREWIPEIAQENWIIVTADAGKSSKEKLPEICTDCGVRHIILSPTLHNAPYKAKKEAFYCLWRHIAKIPRLPRGTRISLRLIQHRLSTLPALLIDKEPFVRWCEQHDILIDD